MTITFEDIKSEVTRLATENPDYVYNSADGVKGCVYNATSTADACIFGQAFRNLGSPVPFYLEQNPVDQVFFHFHIPITTDEGTWAEVVQERQDIGTSWGRAVELANYRHWEDDDDDDDDDDSEEESW